MKQTNKQTNKHLYIISSFTLIILSIFIARNFITKLESLFLMHSIFFQGLVYEK